MKGYLLVVTSMVYIFVPKMIDESDVMWGVSNLWWG